MRAFHNHKLIVWLIILWSFCFSVRRAYIAPLFDHEAHGFMFDGYFYESNGLLYIFLVQCWKHLIGTNLFVIRFMPIIANIGSCCLLYKIAAYIYDKRIAVLTVFFYAIHPMTYYFASYSRFYAFGVFFVLLACYCTIKACDRGSAFLWIVSGAAYLCALNSWILTLVVMIGLWGYLLISGALRHGSYKVILLIAMAVFLNFILLILLDVNGISRISNMPFSLYYILDDIYGLAGFSSLGNGFVDFVCSKFSLSRERCDLYAFICLIFYSLSCLFFMNRHGASKYRCLPPFLFTVALFILAVFSVLKVSLFNSKNLYLLLPVWVMMFSVMIVKFRIVILCLVAWFGSMANYANTEGYVPEYQLRNLLEQSAKIYISDYCSVYFNYYHIRINKHVTVNSSQRTAQLALRSKEPCWLLTNLNKNDMKEKIISEHADSKVFIYSNNDNANIKIYFIVPSCIK